MSSNDTDHPAPSAHEIRKLLLDMVARLAYDLQVA